MTNYKNKVVLITGAGRGLGRELALAFSHAGAIIAVNDINPDNALATVRMIQDAGGIAKDYVVDISKKMPVQVLANQVEDDWKAVDIVINNAGVSPTKALLDMDEWDWRRTVDVNFTGPFLITQVFGRLMRARKHGGLILNIGGNTSPESGKSAYYTSKHGVAALVQSAALELNDDGIHVLGIRFDTPTPENLAETIFGFCENATDYPNGYILHI